MRWIAPVATLFWLAAACGGAAAEAADPKRLALVIGNDAYAQVRPLSKAVSDARAYKRHFEEERGFDRVFYAENADEDAMAAAIGGFLAAVGAGDVAVVVFSGHGVQLDPDRADTLFLLPTDVPAFEGQSADVEYQLGRRAIRFSELRRLLAARRAKTRVFVLDACRDNPFDLGADESRSVGLSRGLAPVRALDGEFVFFAAGPQERALDRLSDEDPDPNSVFSRIFLKRFKPGLFLEGIANDVQLEVYELARDGANFLQRPYYHDGVMGRTCLEETCGVEAAQAPSGAAEPAASAGAPPPTWLDPNASHLFDHAITLESAAVMQGFLETYPGSPLAPAAREWIERWEGRADEAPPAPTLTFSRAAVDLQLVAEGGAEAQWAKRYAYVAIGSELSPQQKIAVMRAAACGFRRREDEPDGDRGLIVLPYQGEVDALTPASALAVYDHPRAQRWIVAAAKALELSFAEDERIDRTGLLVIGSSRPIAERLDTLTLPALAKASVAFADASDLSPRYLERLINQVAANLEAGAFDAGSGLDSAPLRPEDWHDLLATTAETAPDCR